MDPFLRLHIEALHAEFAWRIDRADPSTVADLFTEDGEYGRSTGRRSVGREAIREAYRARGARGPRTARHIFTNVRLHSAGESSASGSAVLTLFAEDGVPPLPAHPLLVADYDDEFERSQQGVWLFKRRTITWVFTREDGALGGTLPLGTSG